MTTNPETSVEQVTSPTETEAEVDVKASDTSVPPETEAQGPTPLQRGREAVELVGDAAQRAGDAVSRAIGRVRNTAELAEERGITTIADEVVGKVAGIAAREVAGVHDLGGDFARGFAALREKVGLGSSEGGEEADRGVRVRLEGTTAVIDLTVVVEFGYVVHSVTDAVRTKVIGSVENMLGLEVTEVNIRVDDVHVEDSQVG